MTGHDRYRVALAYILAVSVAVFGALAQEMDEDGAAVAEEMLIEDALGGDLLLEEDAELDALLEEAAEPEEPEPEMAIEEAVDEEPETEVDDDLAEGMPLDLEDLAEAEVDEEPVDELIEDFEEAAEVIEEPVFEEAPAAEAAEDEALEMTVEEILGEAVPEDEEKGLDMEEAAAAVDLLEEEIREATGVVEEVVAEPILEEEETEPSIDDLLAEPIDEPVEEPFEEPVDELVEEPVVVEEPVDEGEDVSIDDLLAEPFEEEVTEEPEVVDGPEDVSIDDLLSEPFEEEVTEEPEIVDEPEIIEEPEVTEEPVEFVEERPEIEPVEEVVERPTVPPVVGFSDQDVELAAEMEKLRRKALEDHAQEKVAEARKAFKSRLYLDAKKYYEQAQSALQQAGDRPVTRDLRNQIKVELREAIYQQGIAFLKGGDLENAKKFANEATFLGHRKGPALVAKVQKEIDRPPDPPPPPRPRWEQPDFVKKEEDTAKLLKVGREQFMANELDDALATFESVLKADPDNTEAIRWRAKVSQRRFEISSLELKSTRHDMIADVRKAWNPRDYGPAEVRETGRGTPGGKVDPAEKQRREIKAKMQLIVIPEIDFRQANIYDVVEFLQESSVEFDPEGKGVNIILHLGGQEVEADNAGGDFFGAVEKKGDGGDVPLITFRARDVNLEEALKIVTEVASLKYRIEDRVVKIVPLNAPDGKIISRMYNVLPTLRERISIVREDLDNVVNDFNPGVGAGAGGDATDWKEFFRSLGVEWPQGSTIRYLPAIGKMMVANTPENLSMFEQRLADLDIVPKQIEIEARFVEVNQRDLTSLGFEYILTDNWEMFEKDGQEHLHPAARERIQMNATDFTKGQRFLTDAGLAATDLAAPDDVLTIASVLTNPELAFVLHLLQQKGNADLLSAPKVTTQSGVEAMIKVVVEYIYPSDYDITPYTPPTFNADGTVQQVGTPPVVTPQDFEMREVGVILSVLPEVSAEGQMINLTMTPEVVSEPEWRNYGQEYTDGSGNILQIPIEQPFFKTRSVSTSISIYNGATVVMGGMIAEVRVDVDDKIPFLGDLPVIGRLFTSKYESSMKRNLLIFVTARLVDPAGRPIGKIEEIMQDMTPTPGEPQ